MTRTRALPLLLMLATVACNKTEETATTTYAPPTTATETQITSTETQTASTQIAANPPSASPMAIPPTGSTATTVSPVTSLPIKLAPQFTNPPGVDPAQAPRLSIDSIEAEIKAGDVVLVDVRHAEAYQNSHAAGAINIPLTDLPKRMGELPKEKYVVTYCTWPAEESSARAALILQQAGYPRVGALLGGYDAWRGAGLPVENK